MHSALVPLPGAALGEDGAGPPSSLSPALRELFERYRAGAASPQGIAGRHSSGSQAVRPPPSSAPMPTREPLAELSSPAPAAAKSPRFSALGRAIDLLGPTALHESPSILAAGALGRKERSAAVDAALFRSYKVVDARGFSGTSALPAAARSAAFPRPGPSSDPPASVVSLDVVGALPSTEAITAAEKVALWSSKRDFSDRTPMASPAVALAAPLAAKLSGTPTPLATFAPASWDALVKRRAALGSFGAPQRAAAAAPLPASAVLAKFSTVPVEAAATPPTARSDCSSLAHLSSPRFGPSPQPAHPDNQPCLPSGGGESAGDQCSESDCSVSDPELASALARLERLEVALAQERQSTQELSRRYEDVLQERSESHKRDVDALREMLAMTLEMRRQEGSSTGSGDTSGNNTGTPFEISTSSGGASRSGSQSELSAGLPSPPQGPVLPAKD